MVIIVVRLSEDAERGMKFPHEFNRPDLIHPKIVERSANSDRDGDDAHDKAERDVEKRLPGSRRFQPFNGSAFAK